MILSNVNANTNEIDQVKQEFNKSFNTIIKIVKNKLLSKDARNKNIINTIDPIFDFELMAKLSLGKRWKTLTKKQKHDFVAAYVSRMKTSYSSKIDEFSDEKIKINKVKQTKKNRLVMYTSIIGSGDPINIDYKYYKTKKQKQNKKRWLIYDVNIKGISIIKTDRAQFRSILKRSDIDTLIKKMQ
jgi:phospholipid transport system substrate-binding protein